VFGTRGAELGDLGPDRGEHRGDLGSELALDPRNVSRYLRG
jgi:hypothetical protein